MGDGPADDNVVYWPRVKEILDGVMARWKERCGREPYPGIHEYHWDTPQQLVQSAPFGRRLIEPGVPGRETHLVRSLSLGIARMGRMPLRGPFLSTPEIEEIIAWIDAGMPEGPPSDAGGNG